MAQQRSKRYEEIAAATEAEYSPQGTSYPGWWKEHGRKWRNRVGHPRLTAEAAMAEALGLLRSVNRGLFRSDPAMDAKYLEALEALDELVGRFAHQNWQRFKGGA